MIVYAKNKTAIFHSSPTADKQGRHGLFGKQLIWSRTLFWVPAPLEHSTLAFVSPVRWSASSTALFDPFILVNSGLHIGVHVNSQ